jgi:hypothetical protein
MNPSGNPKKLLGMHMNRQEKNKIKFLLIIHPYYDLRKTKNFSIFIGSQTIPF